MSDEVLMLATAARLCRLAMHKLVYNALRLQYGL